MAITKYQRQRIADTCEWFEAVYRPLDGHAPESLRYMALWAVFNALYNIADYPKVSLRGVSSDGGKTIPIIHGRTEDKKLRFIATGLATDNAFIASIIQDQGEFIRYLAQRTPDVQQPPNTQSLHFTHEGGGYTLDLSTLHGIASLDNRLVRENGAVLFQYHHLDYDLDDNAVPQDCQLFMRQLLFMLYQLRNNIVHGGSAAFFMMKTEFTIGAIRLLESIVRHIFEHPELLEQSE